ncbi:MAG TPA: DUF58 domain-containing protein [Anaerolineaceae bacterium]|nr:DUF58 domain-containing protein [Anaerolineaceae bacterium]
MPVDRWVALLLLFFIVGAFFEVPEMVAFATALSVVVGLARLWQQRALSQVSYRRRITYRRGFPGETSDAQLEVSNQKRLPVIWMRSSDGWPTGAPPQDADLLAPSHLPERGWVVNQYSLRWRQRITRNFSFKFEQRGVHPLGPVKLESGDPFGLFESERAETQADRLVVFPRLLNLKALQLNADDPFGDRGARRRLFEDPTQSMGVRDYLPGDDFRRIHWPATARTGQLQARVYQPVTARVMVVCVNVATTRHIWEGVVPALLEELISVSATVIYHAVGDGYSVGLLSNGNLKRADQPFLVAPGRASSQLGKLLETLAGLTAYTTIPFENYLLRAAPRIPLGATLLVVTGIVTPALMETLVQLKRYRAHTTLISLEETPPGPIPGVRVIHLPFLPKDIVQ